VQLLQLVMHFTKHVAKLGQRCVPGVNLGDMLHVVDAQNRTQSCHSPCQLLVRPSLWRRHHLRGEVERMSMLDQERGTELLVGEVQDA